MLSEEEKKAIEECKMSLEVFRFSGISEKDKVLLKAKDLKILSNLIEKQQVEIEKQNKIIDLMAEQLTTPVNNKKWVIEYYTNKAKEDKQ